MPPARTFAITADEKPVTLKRDGTGEIAISVNNSTARPIRGLAKVVPLGAARQEWFSLAGEVERNFSPNGSDQIVVRLMVPPGTQPGRYSFRLDVRSVQNDDDFTEGPPVFFEVAAAPPPTEVKRNWKWLFWLLLALIFLAGGWGVWRLISHVKRPVSEYNFRSTRTLGEPGKVQTITAQYGVSLRRRDNQASDKAPIGEFELRDAQVSGHSETDTDSRALSQAILQLTRTRGEVALGASNMVSVSKWEASRARIAQLTNGTVRTEEILGEFVGAAMVRQEVVFDLAAIFWNIPIKVGVVPHSFYLQAGKGFSRPIRMQDNSSTSQAASGSRSFVVERQAEDGKPFERIGVASYRALDGLLENLDVTIKINKDSPSLRILIERL